MNESQRRERLIKWLDVIYKDLEDLLIDNYIFWEVQSIIQTNPKFSQVPGLFTQWMVFSFQEASAVTVRRQLKTDRNSVSLRRFLEEVLKYPHLVSKEYYMKHFVGVESSRRQDAERYFYLTVGNKNEYIPKEMVERQLKELKDSSEGIEHYVDRRVAHYDQRGLASPAPTFGDLNRCLNSLESIIKTYLSLLKGEISLDSLLPTITVNWKAIFRFPWEEKGIKNG